MDRRAIEQSFTVRRTLDGMSRNNYGTGNVYQRGKRWWIHWSANGHSYRESSKSEDRAKAVKLLKQRLTEGQAGPAVTAKKTTVGELLDLVTRDYRVNGHKSLWWAEMLIAKHLKPALEFVKAANFSSARTQGYIDQRRAAGIANATINHELSLLRRAFKLGAAQEPPLVARVPKIEKLKENNVRTGFLEREQYERVLEAMPAELKPILTFGYYTGCRKAEMLGLRWEQADLAAGTVRLNPGETKNNRGRVIPLATELLDTLKAAKAERDANWPECQWIFQRYGRRIKSFKRAWATACAAAGMPGLLVHDLRRSGVRNLVRAGVPEVVAMAISGHKTRSVFDRYNIVSEEDLMDAARRLDAKVGKK